MRAHRLLHETPSRLELAAPHKPMPCQPHHPRRAQTRPRPSRPASRYRRTAGPAAVDAEASGLLSRSAYRFACSNVRLLSFGGVSVVDQCFRAARRRQVRLAAPAVEDREVDHRAADEARSDGAAAGRLRAWPSGASSSSLRRSLGQPLACSWPPAAGKPGNPPRTLTVPDHQARNPAGNDQARPQWPTRSTTSWNGPRTRLSWPAKAERGAMQERSGHPSSGAAPRWKPVRRAPRR